jgi:acyl-CoA reductase-like NAD-dependent aldehyde dehydrogenase
VHGELLVVGVKAAPSLSPGTIDVLSASTEELIGQVPEAAEGDVDAAVSAARRAFDDPTGWSQWEPARRAEILEGLAERVAAHGDEFAERVSAQNGVPISATRHAEAVNLPVMLRYYAR